MKIETVEITNRELQNFLDNKNETILNRIIEALNKHQLTPKIGFPTLIKNMESLKASKMETLIINGLKFHIFYNPTRSKNVKASTFTDHDNSFSCFLCDLLPGQRGIKFLNNKYMIIVNPGITIPGDLTIPTINHELQKLEPHFSDMLDLAEELTDYSIYFNGPLAGATCPHFHFQAGFRDLLPGEQQITDLLQSNSRNILSKEHLFEDQETEIFRIKNFLRTNYCCYTSSKASAEKFAKTFLFQIKLNNKKFINNLPNIPDFGRDIKVFEEPEEEGRFNVMTKYYPEVQKYLVVFFPKIFNRPQIYFGDAQEQMTLGFAIREALGCVMITQEKDLSRIGENKTILTQAFEDTNLSDEMDKDLFYQIKKSY